MRKRRCPAALLILAELEADKAERWFKRTRSHRAKAAMDAARTAALRLGRRAR